MDVGFRCEGVLLCFVLFDVILMCLSGPGWHCGLPVEKRELVDLIFFDVWFCCSLGH